MIAWAEGLAAEGRDDEARWIAARLRELAERPVTIGLFADNLATLDEMEEFFSPGGLSRERRLIVTCGSTTAWSRCE